MSEKVICEVCGKETWPYREEIFDKKPRTCGAAECQRKLKTKLQRERREQSRQATWAKAEHKRTLWREQKRRQRARVA
jgi:hypothetical protein